VGIDLNADLGEGFGIWQLGDDEALLGLVTSANLACGFHAGDPLTMTRLCASAAARSVAVGAQVGYRDLAGFGRRRIEVGVEELMADVVYQIGALQACAAAASTRVRYVKPHGALYNVSADDAGQADAVARAVASVDRGLAVVGLPGSQHERAAERHGLRFVAEAFADRAYLTDGRLVPRSQPGSVLHDPEAIAARVRRLVEHKELVAIDGAIIHVNAESICVHGDTPGAVAIARLVRDELVAAGAEPASFA
jgi:UPF0271 protein